MNVLTENLLKKTAKRCQMNREQFIDELLSRAIDEAVESFRETMPYYAELQLRMGAGTEIAEESGNIKSMDKKLPHLEEAIDQMEAFVETEKVERRKIWAENILESMRRVYWDLANKNE